jgi:2-polyprenyl-3-methyl-5-hydroxy-6-metoxy-1,4-benzoquinol methylase
MNRDLKDYQKQYAEQPYEKYQVAFRKRKIAELLSQHNHDTLLEVGCGLESIFLDLTSFEELTVLEPAQMFYDKALEDWTKNSHLKVEILNLLLEDSIKALKSKKFDFILVSSLLHEIPDQTKFLQSLSEIASKDTLIHFNVPNAASFHRLLAFEMGLIKSEYEMSASNLQFQQHTVFDLKRLTSLMKSNGFEVIESGSYSFKPFTHSQMQKMIDVNLITEEMLNGFYKMERHLPNLGSEIYVNIKKK